MSESTAVLSSHSPVAQVAGRCHVLIPCAGSGSRSGLNRPKQYEVLAGQRLIDHTVQAFLQAQGVASVTVVVALDDEVYQTPQPRVRVLNQGGPSRAHSVFNGLTTLQAAGVPASDWVLVHDAARCLITSVQIEQLIAACQHDTVGGLLALPLPDTLKVAPAGPAPRSAATLDRSDKWLAQTPQMFRLGDLQHALAQAQASGFAGITDEASAIEALGWQPLLVRGSAQNFKVTYPEDFALAEALLLQRRAASPSQPHTSHTP